MEMLIAAVISMLISIAVGELTAKTPENAKAKGIDQFKFPTISADRSVPVAVGDVLVESANVTWYGDFQKVPIKEKVKISLLRSKKVTVGFEYNVGMELALVWGPVDAIKEVWFDDKLAWSGSVANGDFTVDARDIFGGRGEGGGVYAKCVFYNGDKNQTADPYMTAQVGEAYAHQGLSKLIWKGPSVTGTYMSSGYIEHNYDNLMAGALGLPGWYSKPITVRSGLLTESGSVKPIKARLLILPNYLGSAFSNINGAANPAEAIYMILSGKYIDLVGEPVVPYIADSLIDKVQLTAVAEVLHTEGKGISMQWQTGTPPDNIIKDIERHINGSLVEDPTTGKLQLILARDDYVLEDLLVLDQSNCVLKDYGRRSISSTVNEVVATFTDSSNKFKETPVTVQDVGNMFSQQNHSPVDFDLSMFNDATVATQRASSHLTQLSSILAQGTVDASRVAWQLGPSKRFVLNWPPLGIVGMVCMVAEVTRGDIQNRVISVKFVEDVFAIGSTMYSATIPSNWVTIHAAPAAVTESKVTEVPFLLLEGETAHKVLIFADKPSSNAYQYSILSKLNTGEYIVTAEAMPFIDSAVLLADYGESTAAIDATGFTINSDLTGISEFNWFWIDDELMAVGSYVDNDDGTFTLINIRRGLLDTVPVKHLAGARIWPLEDSTVLPASYANGDTVYSKLLTKTSVGELDSGLAGVISHTITRRADRPYPPGNVTINGNYTPTPVTGDTSIAWVQRDRNELYVRDQDDVNDTVEAGTTVNLNIYDALDVLIRSEVGVSSPYLYTAAQEAIDAGSAQSQLTIELWTVRGGLESHQRQVRTFAKV